MKNYIWYDNGIITLLIHFQRKFPENIGKKLTSNSILTNIVGSLIIHANFHIFVLFFSIELMLSGNNKTWFKIFDRIQNLKTLKCWNALKSKIRIVILK